MIVLEKSCCCSLRAGCIICAVVFLIIRAFALFVHILELCMFIHFTFSRKLLFYDGDDTYLFLDFTKSACLFATVTFCILMIGAAIKEIRSLVGVCMFGFMISESSYFTMNLITHSLVLAANSFHLTYFLIMILLQLILFGVSVYFVILMSSYWSRLRGGNSNSGHVLLRSSTH